MTGYTEKVAENENFSFKDFALMCARSFGALIDMRDEPLDAPLPEKFEPNDYYINRLNEAKAELRKFRANPPKKDELSKRYDEYLFTLGEDIRKENDKRKIIKQRYEAMIDKVKNWQPPTPEHNGLKELMIEQLTDSIEFDCKEYKPRIETKAEYIHVYGNEKYLLDEIAHYERFVKEEKDRCESKNKWIKELRDSL